MFDSGDSLTTGKLPVTLIWIRPLSSLGAVSGSNGEGRNEPSPLGSPRYLDRLLCPVPLSCDWNVSLPLPVSARLGEDRLVGREPDHEELVGVDDCVRCLIADVEADPRETGVERLVVGRHAARHALRRRIACAGSEDVKNADGPGSKIWPRLLPASPSGVGGWN